MPYVNIKITDEKVSQEDKLKLIIGVTELLANILNKNPKTTTVIIDEISTDNWGISGKLVTELSSRA